MSLTEGESKLLQMRQSNLDEREFLREVREVALDDPQKSF